MNKRILLSALLSLSVAFGSAGCKSSSTAQVGSGAALTQLSGEDVSLVIQKLASPEGLQMLASNPKQLEDALKNLRQILALAAEARKTGVADEPDIKQQLEFVGSQVVAMAYDKDQNKVALPDPATGAPAQFPDVKPEEVEAFYKESGSETKYNTFLEIVKKQFTESQIGKPPAPDGAPAAPSQLSETQVKQIRDSYAKTALTERKAQAAGFDKRREVELQVKLQQATLLAGEMTKRKEKEFEVSDAALDEYIKQHPEFDAAQKRAKAEEILKRAKAGEDFGKLANEFSEDPGVKGAAGTGKDGLYENVKKGMFAPEFERAALALEKGQITDLVETQFGYHIIKLEDRKNEKGKDGKAEEVYAARHILISTAAPRDAQNPYAQPKNLKEAARDNIKKEMRDKWVDELAARNSIKVPTAAEVKIEVPPMPMPQTGGMPGTGGEMPPAGANK